MKTILIAVPTNKYVETETMKSIYDLIIPDGYKTELQFFYGYQIDQIRNLIADWGKRYDYVFNVDSDIILPNDTLVKMILHDKDIISGLYIQRIPGTHTLEIYGRNPNTGGVINVPLDILVNASDNNNLVKIAACGMGCCLVKGEVLRKMDYPHFYYKSAIDHKDTVSEDVFFCQKAMDHGFEIFTDVSIRCEHRGAFSFVVGESIQDKMIALSKQDLLPETHVNYLKSLDVSPKVVYDIGAAVLHWTNKAKTIWNDAQYFTVDATPEVEVVLRRSGLPYAIEVLSDESGKEIKFYNNPMNVGGNSYYKENTSHYGEHHAQMRVTKTIDDVAKEKNWPVPDLIKIDVQGAEIDVLKGAKETLVKCKDIILEAQHKDYNQNAPKIDAVIEYMKSIDFELVQNFTRTDVDGDYHFRKYK